MEKISGVIKNIVFKNIDNGYHVLNVGIDQQESIKVTAIHPSLAEGATYDFEGEWDDNKKFGKQFKSTITIESQPTNKEGVKAYLQSSFFPGIGPVIANRIVDYFGDDVLYILEGSSEQLLTIPGISKKKLIKIKESWGQNKEINTIMVFLRSHNISTVFAAKIYNFYKNDCINKILKNPYTLTNDLSGVGFLYADKIALSIGFDKEGYERIKACVVYVLEMAASSKGYCYLTPNQLVDEVLKLIGDIGVEKILGGILDLKNSGDIKTYNSIEDGEDRYYSIKMYNNEMYCAEKVYLLTETTPKLNIDVSEFDNNATIVYSEEQKLAIRGVLNNGVSIITGGAGVGKSSVAKKIVEILLKNKKRVCLVAPTGRAANRLMEIIGGGECFTIHRLLEVDMARGGFKKNEDNLIDYDFLICDETSMVDINLASALLKAIPTKCQVLFLGDFNQIPSIQAGNFFKDLIESNIIKVFRLTKIFRQGKDSDIIKYAHEINEGKLPEIESPFVDPSVWKNRNCIFIDSEAGDMEKQRSEYPDHSSMKYGMNLEKMVLELYTKTIPKYFKDQEIQILTPLNVGIGGTKILNTMIQEVVNPRKSNKPEIKVGDKIFRETDKIIVLKNNYDHMVYNGDIGVIISIDPSERTITCKFVGNKVITLNGVDLFDIGLGYCISIYKAQGSEFPICILPVISQYSFLLSRKLIYTAITRSKNFVVFVGERSALKRGIRKTDSDKRQTSLKEMLLERSRVKISI